MMALFTILITPRGEGLFSGLSSILVLRINDYCLIYHPIYSWGETFIV